MSIKEIKTKLVKHNDGLAIILTPEFTDGTLFTDGADISVTRSGNKLQIKLEDLESKKISCQLCGQHHGKYTCTLCGTIACPNCFWELGRLCKKCMSKK
jgi:late competence protein required for DNA uptake (superfamily II DNA/RNA helicase)